MLQIINGVGLDKKLKLGGPNEVEIGPKFKDLAQQTAKLQLHTGPQSWEHIPTLPQLSLAFPLPFPILHQASFCPTSHSGALNGAVGQKHLVSDSTRKGIFSFVGCLSVCLSVTVFKRF